MKSDEEYDAWDDEMFSGFSLILKGAKEELDAIVEGWADESSMWRDGQWDWITMDHSEVVAHAKIVRALMDAVIAEHEHAEMRYGSSRAKAFAKNKAK